MLERNVKIFENIIPQVVKNAPDCTAADNVQPGRHYDFGCAQTFRFSQRTRFRQRH
ncbi:MAG: hypothetical protein ACLU99_11380 [Alphaproteobacteria bacterium]